MSASYLDLHLEIDCEAGQERNFTIKVMNFVNFPFKGSNIPAVPAYGVYISQLIPYTIACSSY